jgi:DNA-binding cell septation regulator SpoVG
MRTFGNFSKLGSITDPAEQRKALAQAIDLEFSLPAIYAELGGSPRIADVGGIKIIGGGKGDAKIPGADRVKSFLAQKWAVPGDNPNLVDPTLRVVEFFHSNMPEMDTGYTQIYDFVDMRSSTLDRFDILDANNGITFNQVKSGEVVKIRRAVSDNLMSVPYVTFSDGVGIQDDWLRFQKWWAVSDTVAEFNAKAWDKKAQWHYDLLTALPAGINVAFDTDDTKTLNKAAASILRTVNGKGYGAGQNAGFVIVCAPENVGRITKMLTAAAGTLIVAYNANVQPVTVHVSAVVASVKIPANLNGYYLVLPGRKMKRGDWKDLTIESQRNVYVRANDYVGTFQTNAAIGDQDQVARVLFQ